MAEAAHMGKTNTWLVLETDWGTAVDPTTTTSLEAEQLAAVTSVNPSVDNAGWSAYALGDRGAKDVGPGKAAVSGTMDFVWNTGMPFYWALGGLTTGTGSGVGYLWTMTDTSTLKPFTLSVLQDFATTDSQHQLEGCICTGVSFDCSADGGPATGTLSFVAENWVRGSALFTVPTTITVPDGEAVHMGKISVQIPNNTAKTNITGASFSITNNASMHHGLGNRQVKAWVPGNIEYTGTIDIFVEESAIATSSDLLGYILGTAAADTQIMSDVAETTLTLDWNTYATDSADTWEAQFTGVMFDSAALTQAVEGPCTVTIPWRAEGVTVTWSAPFSGAAFD